MNSKEGGEPQAPDSQAHRDKVPVRGRLVLRDSLTARRAAGIIAIATTVITVVGGVLVTLVDHSEYPTFGKGLWFSLQTVTTVGYGDVTPAESSGRAVAAVVMLAGIGFIAVVTAAVTASLVEHSRGRFAALSDADTRQQLERIAERLAAIETKLDGPLTTNHGDARSGPS